MKSVVVTLYSVQNSQIKYGKLPSKLSKVILCNELCVYLIVTSTIYREIYIYVYIMIKSFMMIDPVTGWFKITQYDDKHSINILDLVENIWLTRYTWPTEIAYNHLLFMSSKITLLRSDMELIPIQPHR